MPTSNMTNLTIDLNADVAEGCGQDEALLRIVSSANICCGLHAGSPTEMLKTLQFAKQYGVRVGAHPSYDDRANFGRSNQQLSENDLKAVLLYQLGAIKALCQLVGVPLSYVKPHGALYNQAAKDPQLAQIIAQTIKDFDPTLSVMALSGGELIKASQAIGIRTESEVFADRHYEDTGSLVARTQPNAVIEDDEEALAQVLSMVQHQTVTSISGNVISVQADSVCLHGDNEHAVDFAKRIKNTLQSADVIIVAPTV